MEWRRSGPSSLEYDDEEGDNPCKAKLVEISACALARLDHDRNISKEWVEGDLRFLLGIPHDALGL